MFVGFTDHYEECCQLMKQNYVWLRDFHMQMATMPTYAGINFPLISLKKFAKLCLEQGTDLIVPQ